MTFVYFVSVSVFRFSVFLASSPFNLCVVNFSFMFCSDCLLVFLVLLLHSSFSSVLFFFFTVWDCIVGVLRQLF